VFIPEHLCDEHSAAGNQTETGRECKLRTAALSLPPAAPSILRPVSGLVRRGSVPLEQKAFP